MFKIVENCQRIKKLPFINYRRYAFLLFFILKIKGVFDRPWVQKEIRTAQEEKKNIILVQSIFF